jgi:hypothetical protein
MRATDTFAARKPSATGLLAGDFRRAVLACGLVFSLCVAFVVIASRFQGASLIAPPHVSTEAELRTGSLLVVSPLGERCRERLIDNSTWRIHDKGWVDCEEALAKSANANAESRASGSRLAIIRDGFLGKQ